MFQRLRTSFNDAGGLVSSSAVEPSAIYDPLDAAREEIRILHVHSNAEESAPLSCELEVVSLASDPKPLYEAISYRWQSNNARKRLFIDGKPFLVPAGAVDVIRRFRPKSCLRALWVDAVCIDQTDIPERNIQVALMGKLYSNGVRTLVWLGDADASTEEAIDAIKQISSSLHDRLIDADGNDKAGTLDELVDDPEYWRDLTADGDANSIYKLLSRPWFSRVWVVQEAVLAKSCTCFSGAFEVDWRDVCRAFFCLATGKLNWAYMFGPNLSKVISHVSGAFFKGQKPFLRRMLHRPEWPYSAMQMADIDAAYKSGDTRLPLEDVLDFANVLQCQNPRDIFYGFLGLTSWVRHDGALPPFIPVDYKESVPAVLVDATRAAILEHGSLWILRNVQRWSARSPSDTYVALPSWVPQFDQPFDIAARPKLGYGGKYTGKAVVLESLDANVLVLRGLKVGVVTSTQAFTEARYNMLYLNFWLLTSPTFRPTRVVLNFYHQLHSLFYDISCMLGIPWQRDNLYLAIRTMCGGESPNNCSDADLLNFCDQMLAILSDPAPTEPSLLFRDNELFSGLLFALFRNCSNRCLFRTSQGMLGLGPKDIQEGDQVVWFPGSRVPAIVRDDHNVHERQNDHSDAVSCTLKGLCYIRGVIESEEVLAALEKQDSLKTFEIH